MDGLGRHLLGLTSVQPQYSVATPGKVQVVGDDEGSEPVLPMEPLDQLEDHFSSPIVQIPGRLIGHENLRPRYQGPGQSHALLFASGKLTRTMMAAIAESHLPQPYCCLLHGRPVSGSSHEKRHSNVLLRRKLRQQIVKLPYKAEFPIAKIRGSIICQFARLNLRAVYVTLRSTIKSSQDVQKAAFTRSRLTYDGKHFPLPHPEG